MKKLILLALSILLLCGSSYAQMRQSIKRSSLPKSAVKYMQKNWNNVSPTKIVKISEGIDINYEVTLVDNTVIYFNRDGNWQSITAEKEIVKTAIPAGIRNYVSANAKGKKIVHMYKEENGYAVELDNGKKLHFDSKEK